MGRGARDRQAYAAGVRVHLSRRHDRQGDVSAARLRPHRWLGVASDSPQRPRNLRRQERGCGRHDRRSDGTDRERAGLPRRPRGQGRCRQRKRAWHHRQTLGPRRVQAGAARAGAGTRRTCRTVRRDRAAARTFPRRGAADGRGGGAGVLRHRRRSRHAGAVGTHGSRRPHGQRLRRRSLRMEKHRPRPARPGRATQRSRPMVREIAACIGRSTA